jgi:hypothetical protein
MACLLGGACGAAVAMVVMRAGAKVCCSVLHVALASREHVHVQHWCGDAAARSIL